MHVSLDEVGMEVPAAGTLAELLEGITPHIDPARLVTVVCVNGDRVDCSDRGALSRCRLAGTEAIAVRTEAPIEFAQARRREIAGHVRHIAELFTSVVDRLVAGETARANRALSGAARALGLVLELDEQLGVLDGGRTDCGAIADAVRVIGPRLEAAERGQRWHEVATLLRDELVPALTLPSSEGAA
jgi:hypothetical protein